MRSTPSLLYTIAMLSLLAGPLAGKAQDVKMRVPIISLGRIRTSEIKDGKPIPTVTTRQNVLKYPLLTADLNNCRVTDYKFSLIAPGRPFYGPIYVLGGDVTDSIKTVIKRIDGPGVKLYFEDIHMLYRGDTMDANPVYVQYDE